MRRRGAGHRPENRARGLCGRGRTEGRAPPTCPPAPLRPPADAPLTAAGRALVPTGPGRPPSCPLRARARGAPCRPGRRWDLLPAVSEREGPRLRPSSAPLLGLSCRAAGTETCFLPEVSRRLPRPPRPPRPAPAAELNWNAHFRAQCPPLRTAALWPAQGNCCHPFPKHFFLKTWKEVPGQEEEKICLLETPPTLGEEPRKKIWLLDREKQGLEM
ncbi:atherin [Canis lupus dingo]|uniref:atherin n=1 Tax=Canis lupus dingo TaxID=286419 RepID=UPI0020C27F3E|nr:atherin [Canis lupus dingo]